MSEDRDDAPEELEDDAEVQIPEPDEDGEESPKNQGLLQNLSIGEKRAHSHAGQAARVQQVAAASG